MTTSPVLFRLYQKVVWVVANASWPLLVLLAACHMAVTWIGFALAGEPEITDPVIFIWYYATTATTVGYGDFSPTTNAARIFAVLWLYPGSIALFTTIIAKAITTVSDIWRKQMNGQGDFSDLRNAFVIIGYHEGRTPQMIEEIIAGDEDSPIVLVSRRLETSPDKRIAFVRAECLTDETSLLRAGIRNAHHVVVYADDDEQTLAAALSAAALMGPEAHLVCYFNAENSARLLRSHCPHVEVVVSNAVSQMVRAVQDPGSSAVLSALASTIDDATIFSLRIPSSIGVPRRLSAIAEWLRKTHQANLIAYTMPGSSDPEFNIDHETMLGAGARLYFIRKRRLPEEDVVWSEVPV